jgi:hypothetical protein
MSVSYGGDSITFADGSVTSSGWTGFKNRIINGAMAIDQRYDGSLYTSVGNGTYMLDRFQSYHNLGTLNYQRNLNSIGGPAGFPYYMGLVNTSSSTSGAAEYFNIAQPIEGFNLGDLAWGTASASPVTVSFWVRSSIAGTYSVTLNGQNNSYGYPSTYTINQANTWQYVSVTVPGPTSGTWTANNTNFCSVIWDLGQGSNYRFTPGSWQSGTVQGATGSTNWNQTNGATFYITGVQFEKGSTASSFEYRPYATELALCQRYCYVAGAISGGYTITVGHGLSAGGTSVWRANIFLPVPLRTTPSITETNMIAWNSGFGATAISAPGTIYYLNGGIFLEMDLTTTSNHGITSGYPVFLQTNGSGGKSTFEISAEL